MKDQTLTRTASSGAGRPRVVQTADGFVLAGLHAPPSAGVDMAEQCRLAFEEATTLLEKQGLSLRDVTRIVCQVADADEFPTCFPIFRQFFSTVSPAMTLMWLKDAPASVPRIMFDLIISLPVEGGLDEATF